jgi:hypothetical protein
MDPLRVSRSATVDPVVAMLSFSLVTSSVRSVIRSSRPWVASTRAVMLSCISCATVLSSSKSM